jgi:acyl dehydratase
MVEATFVHSVGTPRAKRQDAQIMVNERPGMTTDRPHDEPVGPLGLRVGQRARRSQQITAREVERYAEITGDRNPLHFDPDFARATRFGRLVAQGGIAAGMLNALVAMDLPGAAASS